MSRGASFTDKQRNVGRGLPSRVGSQPEQNNRGDSMSFTTTEEHRSGAVELSFRKALMDGKDDGVWGKQDCISFHTCEPSYPRKRPRAIEASRSCLI